MEDHELIELIQEYAEYHKSFDIEFIDSIYGAYSEYGELTDGQHQACENIVNRFRMLKWQEDKDKCSICKDGELPWEHQ